MLAPIEISRLEETRQAVGTGEIACLIGASVRHDARRRGAQQALIVARLERARARGPRPVVVHSEPGISTERNAARLGFAMAYSRAIMAVPGPGMAPSP